MYLLLGIYTCKKIPTRPRIGFLLSCLQCTAGNVQNAMFSMQCMQFGVDIASFLIPSKFENAMQCTVCRHDVVRGKVLSKHKSAKQ